MPSDSISRAFANIVDKTNHLILSTCSSTYYLPVESYLSDKNVEKIKNFNNGDKNYEELLKCISASVNDDDISPHWKRVTANIAQEIPLITRFLRNASIVSHIAKWDVTPIDNRFIKMLNWLKENVQPVTFCWFSIYN